jgi:hypothetical protein
MEINKTYKTIIEFQMEQNGQIHEVHFSNRTPTKEEVEQYFEDSCGGVYKWWYKK